MSAVHAAAKKLRVNRPAFFLAVMNILLHRYTAADDILVGMPVMGRPARRFEESVGCFANMMVMRTAVSPNASAAELIAAVQARLTEGLDNAGRSLCRAGSRAWPHAARRPLVSSEFCLSELL